MRRRWIWTMLVIVMSVAAGLSAQAPVAPLTIEQVAKLKLDLSTQAQIGALLNRAADCEGRMLDLPTLKARVAELEAMERKVTDMKKPPAESSTKP